MSGGIRLRHPTHRNVRFNIVERDIPLDQPFQCNPPDLGGCGQVHMFKTHHLNLDETGTVIINKVLFERIKLHLLAGGFTVGEVVKKPPAMGIGLGPQKDGLGQWGNVPIVGMDERS